MKRASIALVIIAALAAGCGEPSSEGQDRSAKSSSKADRTAGNSDPMSGSVTEIRDPNALLGLGALARKADMVVSGTVTSVEPNVKIGVDRTVGYSVLTVTLREIIKGSAAESIDIVMMATSTGAPVNIEGRPIPEVGAVGVWLLERIAPTFDFPGYVLLGPGGGILFDGGGSVSNVEPTIEALDEAAALGSRTKILDRLRETVAGR